MSDLTENMCAELRERFGSAIVDCAVHVGQVTVEVAADKLLETMTALRDEPAFAFGQVVDVCGVDYLEFGKSDWQTSDVASRSGFSRGVQLGIGSDSAGSDGDSERRFAVVYHLLSHTHNRRLRVRVFPPGEPPIVDSVVELWAGVDWFEREAFDLYGILFNGHPDLRRLLTDYGFIGHPFRKDFPLSGEVEVRYDPERRRVVYEPVSIVPRTLVPRVIREQTEMDEAE